MPVEELTKKEQIINFAQNDPFLKISDIAEYVQTTPRYVRTILSEANISLMKLREKYARSMEKRLQVQDEPDPQNSIRLRSLDGTLKAGEMTVEALLDEEYEDLQKINRDEKLWRISQLYFSDGRPFSVKELVTYFPGDLDCEKMESLDSVYEIFGRKGINRLQFKENVIKFEQPSEEARKLLGLKKNDQIMSVSRYILLNKIPIGLECLYFRVDKVELSFSGELVM